MSISRNRHNYCYRIGNDAEQKFKSLIEQRGIQCIEASKDENIHKKIDFFVSGKGIDVKGNKHLDCIWLEIFNVRGNRGWLFGDSDYIAIEIIELNSFCVFPTKDLAEYTNRFTETTQDKTEYYKLYTRKDRLDVIVKVRYEDIKHLEKFKITYER